MLKKFSHFLDKLDKRHYVRVVAFAVLGASLGALIVINFMGATRTVVIHEEIEFKGEVHATPTTAYTMPESGPTRLRIPKIYIDTTFENPLGLKPDQTVEVPKSFEKVGWYKYSPTPGELGPAVILGHVDSYLGPAVFIGLGALEPGDEILIDREDGSTATFAVTALERYEQSGFPTELVYGDIDHAGLRLVTCSGTYDHDTLRYSHNTVVYAQLQEPEAEKLTVPIAD